MEIKPTEAKNNTCKIDVFSLMHDYVDEAYKKAKSDKKSIYEYYKDILFTLNVEEIGELITAFYIDENYDFTLEEVCDVLICINRLLYKYPNVVVGLREALINEPEMDTTEALGHLLKYQKMCCKLDRGIDVEINLSKVLKAVETCLLYFTDMPPYTNLSELQCIMYTKIVRISDIFNNSKDKTK
jgi:hypothetical protein